VEPGLLPSLCILVRFFESVGGTVAIFGRPSPFRYIARTPMEPGASIGLIDCGAWSSDSRKWRDRAWLSRWSI